MSSVLKLYFIVFFPQYSGNYNGWVYAQNTSEEMTVTPNFFYQVREHQHLPSQQVKPNQYSIIQKPMTPMIAENYSIYREDPPIITADDSISPERATLRSDLVTDEYDETVDIESSNDDDVLNTTDVILELIIDMMEDYETPNNESLNR